MIKSMLAIGKLYYKQYAIYKSNFYLFTINRLVEVIVYIFVWKAIYNQTGEAGGLSIEQLITYYILTATLIPFVLWGINEDIAHSIRNGQINRELLNPLTYFQYCFGINIGEMSFAFVVSLATFIICAIIWTVSMPVSILNLILFVVLILIGIPITFFIQMIVGIFGFYSSSIWGMQILRKAIISIFSGIIAPITLFPTWFQKLSNILPFKDLVYTPINIWLGQIETQEVFVIVLKQALWAIILYIIAKAFFNRSIKKITINGG